MAHIMKSKWGEKRPLIHFNAPCLTGTRQKPTQQLRRCRRFSAVRNTYMSELPQDRLAGWAGHASAGHWTSQNDLVFWTGWLLPLQLPFNIYLCFFLFSYACIFLWSRCILLPFVSFLLHTFFLFQISMLSSHHRNAAVCHYSSGILCLGSSPVRWHSLSHS